MSNIPHEKKNYWILDQMISRRNDYQTLWIGDGLDVDHIETNQLGSRPTGTVDQRAINHDDDGGGGCGGHAKGNGVDVYYFKAMVVITSGSSA